MQISAPGDTLTPAAEPRQASPAILVLAALACAAVATLLAADLMRPVPPAFSIAAAATGGGAALPATPDLGLAGCDSMGARTLNWPATACRGDPALQHLAINRCQVGPVGRDQPNQGSHAGMPLLTSSNTWPLRLGVWRRTRGAGRPAWLGEANHGP